jgi:hypothetical protein
MSDEPALREPIRRSISEIAPPPHGSRITYRSPVVPAPSSRREPGLPWLVPASLPPPAPGLHPSRARSAGPPPPAATEAGKPPEPGSAESDWPHWRALLDGPPPDVERIRSTYGEASDSHEATLARSHAHAGSLSQAIKLALQQRMGPEPEWPSQDRPADPMADVPDTEVAAPPS